MTKTIYNIILFLVDTFIYTCVFLFLTKPNSNKSILIVDIDNTIANTFPSLIEKNHLTESDRLKSLPIFIGMRNLIINTYKENRCKILFLSARPFYFWRVTKSWLISNNLPSFSLILVPSAKAKIKYLSLIRNRGWHIKYYDDLTYNQEFNEPLFYNDVIAQVEILDIKYYNANEINIINEDFNKVS